MNDKAAIATFFQDISPKVIELVKKSLSTNAISVQKEHSGDYATQIDLDVEQLVVDEIQRRFLGDAILAEENYKYTQVGDVRTWIIDPICGTGNLARGIPMYCCNIALSVGGELQAACVVDLCSDEYYWSTGGGKIYLADTEYKPKKTVTGTTIEIDTGATPMLPQPIRDNYLESIHWLQRHTDYVFVSLNTSLSFLYVAIHKLDGVVNIAANLWDNAASVFLASQTGCVVTKTDGSPWDIRAGNVTIAIDAQTHQRLIEAYAAGFKNKTDC